jgi:catechol-2,3-dioxygenase
MIRRLNHAVLWVQSAQRSAAFYTEVLDFAVVASMGDQAVFLRAAGSANDHDLGLFTVGARPPAPPQSPGLYHLAWQVGTIDDLGAMRARLLEAGALAGESDHGVSKSLYARDPDGIEFEIMWAAPRDSWPDGPFTARLDLAAELSRWAAVDTADQ